MKLIDFEQLKPEKGIPYSRDHLRRRCKSGTFPMPIKLSDRRIAWIEAEVDAFVADQAAERAAVRDEHDAFSRSDSAADAASLSAAAPP
jgi:predicted DNA-binding transcriptional regulator AlpA